KIKRKHAYHSHILTKKETTQKRNLDHTTLVSRDDEKRVKRMLLGSGM
ncbi:MAG: 50S ribosomal protein L35, partial [Bacteroidales bacterium]|nr:50S ribosomal protein L35 [Bacteroidales bacterium]